MHRLPHYVYGVNTSCHTVISSMRCNNFWNHFCVTFCIKRILRAHKICCYVWPTFYPRPVWPSGIVVACVCLSVCPSVRPSVCVCGKHLLVRAITQHPFKLGSPNLDNRCKRPWLRSLLFWGVIDLDLQGQIELQSQNLPHFELVHAITHHQLKLQFPNLEQKCILALFRSLPILGLIEIDLQFNFYFSNPDQIELFMYIIGIL